MKPAEIQALEIPKDIRTYLRQRGDAERERLRKDGKWSGAVRAHTEYQDRPVEWLVDKLGIPEHTVRWSLNPEYAACSCDTEVCNPSARQGRGSTAHIWDGAVDPLAQALEALARGDDFCLPSGTGTGKTYVVGAAGTLFFLACWERAIVVSLAPKEEQLLSNMWKEIGDLFPRFKKHFPQATLLTGKLRILEEEGGNEVWAATAKTARVDANSELAQNIKGAHGAHMWHIIEEGPGVDPAVIKTAINTSTGSHNPIGMFGNPESVFDQLALFGKRSTTVELRISAYDHPNVVCQREVIEGAVSLKSIRGRLSDANGNPNDPVYKAQIRGIAPEQAAQALIRKEWLEAAATRYTDPEFRIGLQALGADPSNSEQHGKCAIARGQGACLTEIEQRVCTDASVFGDQIVREARSQGIDPNHVGVDAIGVGASTVNEARRQNFWVRAIYGSHSDEPGIDEEQRYRPREEGSDPANPQGEVVMMAEECYRLRDRMYWRLREDLRLGRIAIPPRDHCPQLWDQLLAHTWERPGGVIRLIKKEDIIAALRSSPDCSDAAVYWNWVRPRRPMPVPVRVVPKEQVRNFDTRFEQMMSERERGRSQPTTSRRPF